MHGTATESQVPLLAVLPRQTTGAQSPLHLLSYLAARESEIGLLSFPVPA